MIFYEDYDELIAEYKIQFGNQLKYSEAGGRASALLDILGETYETKFSKGTNRAIVEELNAYLSWYRENNPTIKQYEKITLDSRNLSKDELLYVLRLDHSAETIGIYDEEYEQD